MAIQFFNTLSGKLEEFKPLQKGAVKMYTCGPTVYDFAHIGNFRAYIFEDLLRRWLIYRGYKVTQVMNITDVDDKTIANSLKENQSLENYTKRYTQSFFEDLKTLRIQPAEHYPCATQFIGQMIALVQELIKKEHAYISDGSVYYRIATFPSYGKLSKKNLEENIAGARVDSDEYEKESVHDFALWKKAKEGEPSWDSPWGKGRPGWHIECSAMSMQLLGEHFDIHTGGEDNIFPHHENEIAQSEGASGKKFVNYWLHCKFLLVDGEKMSKSKGNFYTLRDLIQKGVDPLHVRFLLLTHNYRHPLNFTMDGLKQAKASVDRLNELTARVQSLTQFSSKKDSAAVESIQKAQAQFEEAMDEDLNIARAMGILFDFVREKNTRLDKELVFQEEQKEILSFLKKVNQVLDLVKSQETLPQEVTELVQKREQARKSKDFKMSDELRSKISSLGYLVEDTKDGQIVKKK